MIMDDWETVTLADISIGGKGSYGIPAPAIPYSEGRYTYLRITDINDDGTLNLSDRKSLDDPAAQEYLLQPNDIVFARTGNSTGRNYFYNPEDGDLVYAGFLIKFSIDPEKVNPKYIKYYMLSPKYRAWITAFNTGSTRGNINAQTYANMRIDIPPRKQQDLLVDVLSSLDAKIRINNQINRNLEEQAKAIFKSWFVDFEPFGGEPPEDWKTICFSSFLKPRREKSSDSTIPLFAVTNNGIIPRDAKFKKQLSHTGAQNKVAYRTDLVFGMSREILNWGIMQTEIGCISSAYHVFSVSKDIDSRYLEFYIKANIGYFKDLIRPASREGQGLDQQALMSKEILLPPEDIISAYHNIADPIFARIQQINAENQTLSTLRDNLLPKLMSCDNIS